MESPVGALVATLCASAVWQAVYMGFHWFWRPFLHRWSLNEAATSHEWSQRSVNATNAVVMMTSCLAALAQPALRSDFLHGRSTHFAASLYVQLGHELWDMGAMWHLDRLDARRVALDATERRFRGWSMWAHHVLVSLAICAFQWLRIGELALVAGCLMEAISPFIQVRWMLLKRGLAASWLFTVNGVCLLLAYVAFRLVSPVPLLVYWLAQERGIPVSHVPWLLSWWCVAGTIIATAFNVFWFMQILGKLRHRLKHGALGKAKPRSKKKAH